MDIHSKISEIKISKKALVCKPDSTVSDVIILLTDSGGGSILVEDKRRIVGIFTERDFLKKFANTGGNYHQEPIANFMTKNPKHLSEEDSILEALEMMQKGNFRHIVILDEKKELKGVISIKDILEFLTSTIRDLEDNIKDLVRCIA